MRTAQSSKRLLIIGDSIVEGAGVPFDKAFPSQLGDMLRPFGWEILNVGVQGGSPVYYSANVPRYLAFKPDAVVLMIFENDLYDDRKQELNYFNLPLLDSGATLITDSNKRGILARSRVITLLRKAWHKHTRSPLEEVIWGNRAIDTSNQEQEALVELSQFLVAPSVFDQQWAMSENYLDYLVHSLRQRHINVLVTVFSLGALNPTVNEAFGTHARMLERKARDWAESRDLAFLSLFPVTIRAFQAYPAITVMIQNDGHPTEKMHHLLASFMKPWLLENLEQSKHETIAQP
jgi:hypothetical protein